MKKSIISFLIALLSMGYFTELKAQAEEVDVDIMIEDCKSCEDDNKGKDKVQLRLDYGMGLAKELVLNAPVMIGAPEPEINDKLLKVSKFDFLLQYNVNDYFYFASGLSFRNTGSEAMLREDGKDSELLQTVNEQLAVPLNLGFRFKLNNNFSFNAELVPFVAYTLSSKSMEKDLNMKRTIMYDNLDRAFDSDERQLFDAGVGAAIGCDWRAITFRLGADFGLLNQAKPQEANKDYSIKGQQYYFSIGFLL